MSIMRAAVSFKKDSRSLGGTAKKESVVGEANDILAMGDEGNLTGGVESKIGGEDAIA